MCCCAENIALEPSFIMKVLPTLVGGGISAFLAVALFMAGKKKDSKLRKEEAETISAIRKAEINRSWYLNVLVNPNLVKVEDFFKDVRILTCSTVDILIEKKKGSIPNYKLAKAAEIVKFKEQLNQFDLDFLELIKSNNQNIFQELLEWQLELEDMVLNYYDNVFEAEEIDPSDLKKSLSEMKSRFFKILNRPILAE